MPSQNLQMKSTYKPLWEYYALITEELTKFRSVYQISIMEQKLVVALDRSTPEYLNDILVLTAADPDDVVVYSTGS
jgi:hypothetical protein